MDGNNRPRDVAQQTLEDHPDLSLFMARLYQRLGGRLEIDPQGRRKLSLPVPLDAVDVPQLPDANRGDRFSGIDEWRGAARLVEYYLSRLGAADKERVFNALAVTDTRGQPDFDFRALIGPGG